VDAVSNPDRAQLASLSRWPPAVPGIDFPSASDDVGPGLAIKDTKRPLTPVSLSPVLDSPDGAALAVESIPLDRMARELRKRAGDAFALGQDAKARVLRDLSDQIVQIAADEQ
jgi:hypothetical protein